MPEFTEAELNELADHICGRVEALNDILASPRLPESTRKGIKSDLSSLTALDAKLRPYYKDGKK